MNGDNLDRKAITLEVSNNLLKEIRAGDFDHGLSVAEMFLSEGPKFDPEILIVLIEAVIELSSQAGSLSAKEYLSERWPVLKTSHLRRLKNKDDQST